MSIYGTPSRKTAYASLSPLTIASNNIPSIKIVNNGGSFSIRSNLNTKTSQLITEQQQSSNIESRQRINKLASNPTIESEMETDSELLQNWKPVKTSSKKRKVNPKKLKI